MARRQKTIVKAIRAKQLPKLKNTCSVFYHYLSESISQLSQHYNMDTTFFYFLVAGMLLNSNLLDAQWTGKYIGSVNGDQVSMDLKQNGSMLTGTMKDAQQTFDISGEINGNRFAGQAIEKSLSLNCTLLGEKSKDQIHFNLMVDFLGQISETPFTVTKQGDVNPAQATIKSKPGPGVTFPAGANFPVALVGKWTKSETYNSGYGDNFMGANFSQSLVFQNDGSVEEGGSSASMSGSNYFGQSSGNNSNATNNVKWYAIGNQLFLYINNNGNWQSVKLGSWYTENNHLLITGQDGTKLLLSR